MGGSTLGPISHAIVVSSRQYYYTYIVEIGLRYRIFSDLPIFNVVLSMRLPKAPQYSSYVRREKSSRRIIDVTLAPRADSFCKHIKFLSDQHKMSALSKKSFCFSSFNVIKVGE